MSLASAVFVNHFNPWASAEFVHSGASSPTSSAALSRSILSSLDYELLSSDSLLWLLDSSMPSFESSVILQGTLDTDWSESQRMRQKRPFFVADLTTPKPKALSQSSPNSCFDYLRSEFSSKAVAFTLTQLPATRCGRHSEWLLQAAKKLICYGNLTLFLRASLSYRGLHLSCVSYLWDSY